MDKLDWKTLVSSIKKGHCILVLGPDIARDSLNGDRKPLTEILSNQFADKVEEDKKVLDRNDLAHTAQLYVDLKSESALRLYTADFYLDRQTEVSGLYRDLAAVPFQLIVNATPDILLIQAFEEVDKKYLVDHYNYNGKKRDMVTWNSRDKPLIYYLYGSATVDESLVISERHLLEFLVKIISSNPPIQNNIISEFRDRETCFLFLGFGFRNWYLRILLYVLLGGKENREKESPSFALEEILPDDDTDFKEISVLFGKGLKIDFSDMGVAQFVKELRQHYEAEHARAEDAVTPESELGEEAPTVFICHASEDKKTAMALHEKLREGGIRSWIDQEGIRGGDQWDRLLKTTIKDEVDYFLVLQSTALFEKEEGYVNTEISLALERQKTFRYPKRFILPVKIDESELLEDLEDIQTIDLRDLNEGVQALLKTIRRDQQRRKK